MDDDTLNANPATSTTPAPACRRPHRARWCAGAFAALALAAAPVAWSAPAPLASRFEAGAEGWTVRDLTPLPDPGQPATHLPAEGAIGALDVHPWTVYSAPAAFLGDLGGYAGGTISFELSVDDRDADADRLPTLLLRSGADFLAWLGGVPGTGLTPFSAVLAPSPRWLIGQQPTALAPAGAADFARVLGAVDALFVNADWKTASQDSARLDNVVLAAAVPEPALPALLGAGTLAALAASAGGRRRRNRARSA